MALEKCRHMRPSNLKDEIVSETTNTGPRYYWDHVAHEFLKDGNFVQVKFTSSERKHCNKEMEIINELK